MAGNVGSVAVRAGFDGSDLSRGLRRSKSELEEFAKNAKRAFQFGVGEAGVNVLRSGVELTTAALRAMRGDTEAVWEELKKLPFGIGALIDAGRRLWQELPFQRAAAQIKEATAALREFSSVVAQMDAARAASALPPSGRTRGGAMSSLTAAYLSALSEMPGDNELEAARRRAENNRRKLESFQRAPRQLTIFGDILSNPTTGGMEGALRRDAQESEAQYRKMLDARAELDRQYRNEITKIEKQYRADQREEIRKTTADRIKEERDADVKLLDLKRDTLEALDRIEARRSEQWWRAVSIRQGRFDKDPTVRGAIDKFRGNKGMPGILGLVDLVGDIAIAGAFAERERRRVLEEDRKANQERFEEAAAAGARGQRVLDDINRENRIMRVRAKKGELAADLQAIHEEYEAKRQALRDENADLNADAIKALQQGERMALAERRKQAVATRHSLVDISGQALMLGAPNPADSSRFLFRPFRQFFDNTPGAPDRATKEMAGHLSKMNRREGRQDFAVRQWGPAFGGG